MSVCRLLQLMQPFQSLIITFHSSPSKINSLCITMMSFTRAMVICLSVYYLSRGKGGVLLCSFYASCIPPFLFAIHLLSWMDKRTPDQRRLGLRPHKLLQQLVSGPHGHLGLPGHQTDANTTDDDLASGPQPLEQWVMWSLGHPLGEEGFQLRQ